LPFSIPGWEQSGANPPQSRINPGFFKTFRTLPQQRLFNEWYAKDTSKKIKRAIGARQKEGTLMTKPPFGYCRDTKDKSIIKIVPKEAEFIKMVYDLYISGSGYRKIANYLTDQGIPTPSMVQR